MDVAKKLFSYTDIKFESLPLTDRIGVDGHIARINNLYRKSSFGLSELHEYLQNQKHLKPQSLDVLAKGIKCSVKMELGLDYELNPDIHHTIDRAFALHYCKRKHRVKALDIPIEDLKKFIHESGMVASFWAEFLFLSSLRVSEACNVKLEHIRIDGSTATITALQKGNSWNEVIVSTSIIQEIKAAFRSKIYLFENKYGKPYNRKEVYNNLTSQSKRILGYSLNPHRLRHTFATYIAKNSPDKIRAAMNQMNHRSYDMFMGQYVRQNFEEGDVPRIR